MAAISEKTKAFLTCPKCGHFGFDFKMDYIGNRDGIAESQLLKCIKCLEPIATISNPAFG